MTTSSPLQLRYILQDGPYNDDGLRFYTKFYAYTYPYIYTARLVYITALYAATIY